VLHRTCGLEPYPEHALEFYDRLRPLIRAPAFQRQYYHTFSGRTPDSQTFAAFIRAPPYSGLRKRVPYNGLSQRQRVLPHYATAWNDASRGPRHPLLRRPHPCRRARSTRHHTTRDKRGHVSTYALTLPLGPFRYSVQGGANERRTSRTPADPLVRRMSAVRASAGGGEIHGDEGLHVVLSVSFGLVASCCCATLAGCGSLRSVACGVRVCVYSDGWIEGRS